MPGRRATLPVPAVVLVYCCHHRTGQCPLPLAWKAQCTCNGQPVPSLWGESLECCRGCLWATASVQVCFLAPVPALCAGVISMSDDSLRRWGAGTGVQLEDRQAPPCLSGETLGMLKAEDRDPQRLPGGTYSLCRNGVGSAKEGASMRHQGPSGALSYRIGPRGCEKLGRCGVFLIHGLVWWGSRAGRGGAFCQG